MNLTSLTDTIAAIATSSGEAGIGIVRLSGVDALAVADKIFFARNTKAAAEFRSHTLHYGWVKNAAGEVIDEALLSVMRAPHTYTREDVVEINCHGGAVVLRAVLEAVLASGARLAEPGEFTRRAFLNGRIDLAQAEAVLDIIRAKTDAALIMGQNQLSGALSSAVRSLQDEILAVAASLEAAIDFPEEETGSLDLKELGRRLLELEAKLSKLCSSGRRGRLLREGIRTVICGSPNVGKSSLLNALLKKERSIVTALAGTTRDTVEEIIDIRGFPLLIVDTAGILKPRNIVEKKALSRSRQAIESADITLLVFDASRRLSSSDRALIAKLNKQRCIAVLNKSDKVSRIEHKIIAKHFSRIVTVSARKLIGIEDLEDEIVSFLARQASLINEPVLVSNLRHMQKFNRAQKHIEQALNSLDNRLSLEFIATDVKSALGCLDDIIGKGVSGDLLEKIFSDFCIGK